MSLRASLLLVVMVPMLGLGLLSAQATLRSSAERSASARLEREAIALADIVSARTLVAHEEVASAVLALGADLGADADQLSDLYGVDYEAALATARLAVDHDPILSGDRTLAASMDSLRALRPAIDAGDAGFDRVHLVLLALTSDVDDLWIERFGAYRDELAGNSFPATVYTRLDVLHSTFLALAAGSDRVAIATRVVLGEPILDDTQALLDATSRYDLAIEAFTDRLGPRAAAAWSAHRAEPATRRFDATLDQVTRVALRGEPSPLSGNPAAFGAAFIDGAPWASGLSETVQQAGADVQEVASRRAADATRALRIQLAVSVALAALSIAGALALARRVTRPVRRLETAAHQVHEGRFDLPPMATTGPRELADTAAAFNDMTMTLAAVEAQAVALADDAGTDVPAGPLPGRTGLALQVALNRLRSSIQMAEQRREELHAAATHDALTGLLNRAAAVEMIGRDLARVERDGGAVMALFVDLDNLKVINDRHGHAVGDDALRLTAHALRTATRASDITARVGGDEFLVGGVVDGGAAEVGQMAERVRQAVADQLVVCPDESVALRCSVGMAIAGAGTTVEALVNEADAAMYEAKRAGRNRVSWSPALTPRR